MYVICRADTCFKENPDIKELCSSTGLVHQSDLDSCSKVQTQQVDFKSQTGMSEFSKLMDKLTAELQCSICLDTYKNPKLLNCFHVFCKCCLDKLYTAQGNHKICCPTCRCNTPVSDPGASTLQTAFHIENIIEIHGLLTATKGDLCENCKKTSACIFCKQCRKCLCSSCKQVHDSWGAFNDHSIISLSEAQSNPAALVQKHKVKLCLKHEKKELELFCESCEEVICSHCIIRQHKDHQYDLVADVFTRHKEIIVASIVSLRKHQEVIGQALLAFDVREQDISQQDRTVEHKIKESIGQLIEVLQQRESALLSDLHQITEHKLKALSVQWERVEIILMQVDTCLAFAEESLADGNEGEILATKKAFLKQAEVIINDIGQETLNPIE